MKWKTVRVVVEVRTTEDGPTPKRLGQVVREIVGVFPPKLALHHRDAKFGKVVVKEYNRVVRADKDKAEREIEATARQLEQLFKEP